MLVSKKIVNFLIIILFTYITFWWTFFIFHDPFDVSIVLVIVSVRLIVSYISKDYKISWSGATQQTFLFKSAINIVPFVLYALYFHGVYRFAFLISELFFYMFMLNLFVYLYYYWSNRSSVKKVKSVAIYGSGSAGLKLGSEFRHSKYMVKCFVDDDRHKQGRSIDLVPVVSPHQLESMSCDMLVIAIPSAKQSRINEIYDHYSTKFQQIKILPSLENILQKKSLNLQLKEISVEDLLARYPSDLDKGAIKEFIRDKVVLVTGAGGSIGSEIVRQCLGFDAKQIIALDHSEYNLYTIDQELETHKIIPVMQSVTDKNSLEKTFDTYKPDLVIHAAAYKHVPLCEANISEAIRNNIWGTKNVIDLSIEHSVQKIVLISTDKAVNPTNVMGATKRVCELYLQNVDAKQTNISATRFGNVLGSSGSIIPKFKQLISEGKNLRVTHKDITRYFMLIPEACILVLQSSALGRGGEIFILDMGEPVKIMDLAYKMIELSGRDDIGVDVVGLRAGEKLYEELLVQGTQMKTKYDSITIAKTDSYPIERLNRDIKELLELQDEDKMLYKLKEIVPEFNHNKTGGQR